MVSNSSMKIGLRLQQTDEHLAAREKFIHLPKRLKMPALILCEF
jgi:hypothetical protein